MLLNILSISLPLTDPVIKFLIILIIILTIPILSNKVKIPHLLGMILAGVIIGPFGLNLLARDSGIILSGTAGLLYIMFLAGLEINLNDFKKNVGKSTLLGLYGFLIPMTLGTLTGIYILKFSIITSVLLASMFASHTLITYPIVSKLGIAKNIAVNISVGSTLITNTLALIVLAVIVGMSAGEIDNNFWIILSLSFIGFSAVIYLIFPIISRWFFKRYSDSVSQYIFVLVIVFLGATLSQVAGIEAIIGAFMSGLALNRLIPRTSPLMNRIDFVGNAIFIPFFLIGVGMLIDYRAFGNVDTLFIAFIMTIVATTGKYLASWLTQKNFKLSNNERKLIFGLTNSQAAATLAAVLVGYNIILGYTENDEPIRLLNDSVLNGTIVMILVTCTIASFATQKSAQSIALLELYEDEPFISTERILIPLNNPASIEELINFSTIIKSKRNKQGLFALNIINSETTDSNAEKNARKLLEKAKIIASATDIELNTLLRYDLNVVNGVTSIIKENRITDLIIGLHIKSDETDSYFGTFTESILAKSNVSTFIYHSFQPISTIKRHILVIPPNAEYEVGFTFWLVKIWNIAENTGAEVSFYSTESIIKLIKEVNQAHPINANYQEFANWDEFLILSRDIKSDDNLIIVLSRKNYLSFNPEMTKIPMFLNKYYSSNNYVLIFPAQSISIIENKVDLTNSSLIEAIEKVDIIGKTISQIFQKRQTHISKRF